MFGKLKTFRIALMFAFAMIAGTLQAQTVTGNVKDSSGEPIIGATIMEAGTKNGAVTDIDGNFTIKLQKGGNLNVSYVGMKTQNVKTAGKTNVSVVLEDDANTLSDIVVVGYGTMKKSDVTGSVSSVGTEKLNAKGAPGVMENLQGSTPGVNITQSSGRTGGDFDIEVRGKSSINSSTKPLFVVDGVMCDDINWLNPQDIERIDVLKDASSTAIYGSRATAGVVMVTTKSGSTVSREQKATISYDGYYGWTTTARMPDFMTGEQFYQYRFLKFLEPVSEANGMINNPAMPNYGMASPATLEQCLLAYEPGQNRYALKEMLASGNTYDWPGLITRTGSQQNHYLSVNGGSKSVNYHFGVGYSGEKGIYKNDDQSRFNFKGAVDAKITKVISAGFNINAARTDNTYAYERAVQQAFRMNPYMRPYDEAGEIIYKPGNYEALGTNQAYQFSDQRNPLNLEQAAQQKRETWRVLGNVYLKFDIIKGLDFKTTFSPSYTNYREGFFGGYINPANGLAYNDDKSNSGGWENGDNTATLTTRRKFSYTWDNIINYNTTIAKDHSLSVMGLFSTQKYDDEQVVWAANNVRENTDWWNLVSGDFNKDDSKNSYSENSMISWAARLNYSYKSKYLLTATVRWDGSSKFAEGNRWGSFPSVALAWRITEENFMKKIDWISNLKLRVSYGITGNCDGIGNYDTQQVLGSPVSYPFGGQYSTGYYAQKIVNQNLKWEKSKEWNFGLDFGFLRNRINGTIDVYNKKSEDLLYNVDLPLESGGGSMVTNIGSVRNTGVEISLNTINVQTKDWNWQTTFTFAHNKNKVLEINGNGDEVLSTSTSGYNAVNKNLFVGSSVNTAYTYEIGGIVSNRLMTVPDHKIAIDNGFTPGASVVEAEYYKKCYNLTEGQPWIIDRDGNGTFDNHDKRVFSRDPVWTGSFTSNLSWKNIDFSFSLYAKINYKVYSSFMSEYLGWQDRGRQKLQVDYYIPAGTLLNCDGMNPDGSYINPVYQEVTHYGEYPFPNNGMSNAGVGPQKDYWDMAKCVQNGSYVKVKNITLGYTFSKSLLKSWGCQHLRLYFTVTNPFVFTGYKGFDPEWANCSSLTNDAPSTVTYQLGASIKF